MHAAITALFSAACWGTSDFLGGVAARRISPYLAVALAHALSLSAVLAVVVLMGFHAPAPALIFTGLIAGCFGGGGLMLFYYALARGSMGVTAALAGVLTAAVPMLFGLHTEGLPKVHQVTGFGVAVAAIWLVASSPGRVNRSSAWLGTVSGLCFGIYFVLLKLASAGGAIWAMTMSRITSTALASLLCLYFAFRPRAGAPASRWGAKTLALCAAAGVLDTGGNLLYIAATRLGRLDVAAVLSSLYPAVTILLAAWLLKERTTRAQALGMALALGAVVLIAG